MRPSQVNAFLPRVWPAGQTRRVLTETVCAVGDRGEAGRRVCFSGNVGGGGVGGLGGLSVHPDRPARPPGLNMRTATAGLRPRLPCPSLAAGRLCVPEGVCVTVRAEPRECL